MSEPAQADQVLQSAVEILRSQVDLVARKQPAKRSLADIRMVLAIAEMLRRLESDLNDPIDMRSLSRMSDHDLDRLQKRLGGDE